MTCSLVANEIVDTVEKKPKTTPIDMLNFYTDKYGVDLPYYSDWLGVEKVGGIIRTL